MRYRGKKWRGIIVAATLSLSQLSFMSGAIAQVNTIKVTLAASEPTSYNHATGGGYWNLGRENIDIRKSLQGENFACDDTVSYLTQVNVPNNPSLIANGAMTIDMNYSIGMDTTGDSGLALE